MPRSLPLLFVSALLLGATACAASGADGTRATRGIITAADVEALSVGSAHEVVARLRPAWLRSRGTPSIQAAGSGYPIVFVDHARFGAPASLWQIRAQDIESILFLSAREATTYHGTGYPSGIIQVTTKR